MRMRKPGGKNQFTSFRSRCGDEFPLGHVRCRETSILEWKESSFQKFICKLNQWHKIFIIQFGEQENDSLKSHTIHHSRRKSTPHKTTIFTSVCMLLMSLCQKLISHHNRRRLDGIFRHTLFMTMWKVFERFSKETTFSSFINNSIFCVPCL